MILDIAAKRASLTPDGPAVWWRGEWLTYRTLDARATNVARAMHHRGVRKGDRVSILAFNHIAHIDLMLATAKLGFIYAPLNYRLSAREQRNILAYLRPSLLLVDEENAGAMRASEDVLSGKIPYECDEIPLEHYDAWVQRAHTLAGADTSAGSHTSASAQSSESAEPFEGVESHEGAQPPENTPSFESAESFENAQASKSAQATGSAPISDLDPEDTQMILLTGGTTGLPKGAMQPYRQGVFNAVNTVLSWGLRHDDCVIQATPCFHAAVNAFTVPLLHHGARVVLMERFEPGAYLDLVQETGATILFMVPTMYKMLADHESFASTDFSGVRWAISGGAPCPDPVREAFAARGVRFKQGYGLTEAGVNCFAIELDDAAERPGSVGKPVLHAEACIRRPDGSPADPGEVGELTLSGPHVFSGYFERPDATDQVLRGGWLWTGDLATVDADGFYTIVGRSKEMFISGGENVYPVEIENALYDHPGVSECAVVGVPDARWGEVGLAVIVPRAQEPAWDDQVTKSDEHQPGAHSGHELDAHLVRAHVKERLASFKVPKHVRFVTALPKSGAGKILKSELVREFTSESPASSTDRLETNRA